MIFKFQLMLIISIIPFIKNHHSRISIKIIIPVTLQYITPISIL